MHFSITQENRKAPLDVSSLACIDIHFNGLNNHNNDEILVIIRYYHFFTVLYVQTFKLGLAQLRFQNRFSDVILFQPSFSAAHTYLDLVQLLQS